MNQESSLAKGMILEVSSNAVQMKRIKMIAWETSKFPETFLI